MGTSENAHETSTAAEFDDTGLRIARAVIAMHGKTNASLERIRDQFIGAMEFCPRCRFYLAGKCPACAACVVVLSEIEKKLANRPEVKPGQQDILERRYP